MNAAIGKLLTQFDANGRAKSPPPPPPPKIQDVLTRKEVRREPQSQPQPQAQRQAHAQPQLQPPPAPAPEAAPVNLLEDAYRRGHTAGLAEGESKLAEERVRSAIRLGEERAKWSDQQAVAIVNGFDTACREIESNIASSVARILLPFLADAVRDKAIGSLVEQIAALTSNSPVPVFRVTGPRDLIDLVRTQLDLAGRSGVEYQSADTVEVRVLADQTTIETQISTWVDRLKEARR
jgi:flagellar biosynthesis/type III secretory pathway protein FliH